LTETSGPNAAAAGRAMILPMALAQFIASYAATNMSVAISAIATDLGTDAAGGADGDHAVHADQGRADDPGQQADRHLGRKRCLVLGLIVYGVGGVLALLSFGLAQLRPRGVPGAFGDEPAHG
jgi:MFS family permease